MKVLNLFLYSTGVILLTTAGAKFISCAAHGTIFQTVDPLLGFKFRSLFIMAGCIETIVALVCLFKNQLILKLGLVAWLSTVIVLYRIGLFLIHWHKPCSCLGTLTDALHIQPQTADTTMKIILAYMLIGSYATLFWLWRQRKKAASSAVDANLCKNAIAK